MAAYLFALAYLAAFVTYRVDAAFHRNRLRPSMEDIAVFVIVALAAIYAAWKLMPRALRARLAQATVGWVQRRGRLSDQRRRRPRAAPHGERMRPLRQLRHLWPRAGPRRATGRIRTALHAAAMTVGPLVGQPLDSREALGEVSHERSYQLPRECGHHAGFHAPGDQPGHLACRLLDRNGEG